MKSLKISIPKPCHEDWNKMTQNEKGRFCNSCAKTVVDFTKKSPNEIKNYLLENINNGVCGHFYKKQLDAITIEIPEQVLYQKLSFTKLFLLVLLLTMGTTLFSCKTEGKIQKIDNVVLIDSIKNINNQIDSVKNKTELPPPPPALGMIQTTGIIAPPPTKDSIVEVITTVGELRINPTDSITIEGGISIEPSDYSSEPIPFVAVDIPPRFKKNYTNSTSDLKQLFQENIQKFISSKFNLETTINLDLTKGKKRIYTKFKIDNLGYITNIHARAPHKKLEEEAKRVIKKLPQLIPAKHNGKKVSVSYVIPITFEVE